MLNHQRKFAIVLLVFFSLATPLSIEIIRAQTVSVSTIPSGYFTLTIQAGFGTSSSVSVLSFPLQGIASASGQIAGVITGLTANTFTNSNAGWTASQLSTPTTPYLLQITSGAAAGRTFLLSTSTANTATTVTLDPLDATQTNLTTLGIVTGTDTYQIIPADTISSIFGTPATTGILGGTSPAGPNPPDRLQVLLSNGWNAFYYNTTNNQWTLTTPPFTSGNNIVIRPDTGVVYSRYGTTAINIVLAGQVPSVTRQTLVANSGITALSNNWPIDQTLAATGIQNLSNWASGPSSSSDDLVQLLTASGWNQYYYNGTHWIMVTPPFLNSDNVTVPAGTIVDIIKRGATLGNSVLTQVLPYSLN